MSRDLRLSWGCPSSVWYLYGVACAVPSSRQSETIGADRPDRSGRERRNGGNDADEDECREEAEPGRAEQLNGKSCGGLLDGAALCAFMFHDGDVKLWQG